MGLGKDGCNLTCSSLQSTVAKQSHAISLPVVAVGMPWSCFEDAFRNFQICGAATFDPRTSAQVADAPRGLRLSGWQSIRTEIPRIPDSSEHVSRQGFHEFELCDAFCKQEDEQ